MVSALVLAAALGVATPTPACDPSCERHTAEALLGAGDQRAAVDALRTAVARFPGERSLHLLLARAYLLQDNLFWAERVLREALERWPDDAELRAWLAAVHLRQADPKLVAADLAPSRRPTSGPSVARWHLLDGLRASLEHDPDGLAAAIAGLAAAPSLWPEDAPLWAELHSRADPWWREPLSTALELGAGHTSNALAGSPTDPGATGTASALGVLELYTTYAPNGGGRLRPQLDLDLRGVGIREPAQRDLSSLDAGLRVALQRAVGGWRWLAGYRAEMLLLDQQPARFADAHRLEIELESTSGLLLLVGGGRRSYRDHRRSRWEADAALGVPWRVLPRLPLVVGATLRWADATSPAYDQRGLSLAAAARLVLGGGFTAELAATGALDDFPHSGGAEGRLVFGTDEVRRDLLGRLTVGLWTPPWRGLQAGLEGRLARRDSTADDTPGLDFGYDETRFSLLLRWRLAADPARPALTAEADHVPLDWGLEARAGLERDRILDLLRRDEELRRSSSCAIP